MDFRLLPCKVHMAERVYLARLGDLQDWPEETLRGGTWGYKSRLASVSDGAISSLAPPPRQRRCGPDSTGDHGMIGFGFFLCRD